MQKTLFVESKNIQNAKYWKQYVTETPVRHVVTFFGYCLTVFIRALMVIWIVFPAHLANSATWPWDISLSYFIDSIFLAVLFSVFLFCMCFAYLTINLSNKVGFEFLSNFKHRQTINNALYHNEHVLNWDKISCRKIPLNFGLLFQNLIYIGNISTLLQLLILNKAYYLQIKIGLINESHQIFSN